MSDNVLAEWDIWDFGEIASLVAAKDVHNLPPGVEGVPVASLGRGKGHQAEPVADILLVKELPLAFQKVALRSHQDRAPFRVIEKLPLAILRLPDKDEPQTAAVWGLPLPAQVYSLSVATSWEVLAGVWVEGYGWVLQEDNWAEIRLKLDQETQSLQGCPCLVYCHPATHQAGLQV